MQLSDAITGFATWLPPPSSLLLTPATTAIRLLLFLQPHLRKKRIFPWKSVVCLGCRFSRSAVLVLAHATRLALHLFPESLRLHPHPPSLPCPTDLWTPRRMPPHRFSGRRPVASCVLPSSSSPAAPMSATTSRSRRLHRQQHTTERNLWPSRQPFLFGRSSTLCFVAFHRFSCCVGPPLCSFLFLFLFFPNG